MDDDFKKIIDEKTKQALFLKLPLEVR